MHNCIHALLRQAGILRCTPEVCAYTVELLERWAKNVIESAVQLKNSTSSESEPIVNRFLANIFWKKIQY